MQVQPRFSGLLVDTRLNGDGNTQTTRATLVPTDFPGVRQDEVRIRKTYAEDGTGAKVVENYRFQDNQIGEATRMLDFDAALREPMSDEGEPHAMQALQNLSAIKTMFPELIASVFNNIAPGEVDTKITRTLDGDTQELDINNVSIADIEHGVRGYVDVFMNAENNSEDVNFTTQEAKEADENAPQTWLSRFRPYRETQQISVGGQDYDGAGVTLSTTHDVLKPL